MEPRAPDEASSHPPAHALDALAAGDANASASAHLATCAGCARYVESLRTEVASFRAASDPKAFVARVSASAVGKERSRTVRRVAWVAAPAFAAAAVLMLVVRAHAPNGGSARGAGEAQTSAPSEQRFKGGLAVAVVLERAGAQTRLSGPLTVRAGDRLRVEVSHDRDEPLTAGLLADDGEWHSLLAPAELEAGTHYSELAARFDESPTKATLLVGSPGAVERARRTRDFTDVTAWRVTSEATGP